MTTPFGAAPPTAFQDRIRRLARRLPTNWFGRKGASLLLGPAGGRGRRAFDVTVFDTQRARLHPYDNICEKRVFLTPQLWDGAERASLAAFMTTCAGRDFHFVDVGANAGLYSLFARAEAQASGAKLKALAIEADPEMAARLRFNIAASGAGADIVVIEAAASDAEGMAAFIVDRASRGLSRVDSAGAVRVMARPLLAILRDAGFAARIDAMKIDVEGHEYRIIRAFLDAAPTTLRPRLIILETSHAGAPPTALDALKGVGYVLRLATARNAILLREDQTPG